MANQPTSFRYPYQHPDPHTDNGFRLLFQGNKDLNDAIVALNSKLSKTASQITNQVNESINNVVNNITGTPLPVAVTQQTADYILQQTDFGGLVIFTGTGPYALTLNNGITTPFYAACLNLSSGNITASPVSPFLVNNLTSVTVLPTQWAFFYFDGVNWWALDLQIWPITKTATSHQWLNSYNAATGLFTASQPAFSDISGVAGVFQTTHAEPLTDGNGNFIFAATLTTGGDIIVCEGIYP